jgi:hypothetical protein
MRQGFLESANLVLVWVSTLIVSSALYTARTGISADLWNCFDALHAP